MRDTRYRFWGKADPRGRTKSPILAAVPEADVTDGVATMRIYDPIDSWGDIWGTSAKDVVAALAALPDGTTDIHLHLNSPGGEVYEGIAIVNALRNHPATVTAIVDGLAASAASFIASAADVLVMGQNTELMIHDAWGIAIGPAEDMRQMGDMLDRLSNNIASIYQAKAGGDLTSWRALMLAETWYGAAEAVAAGLADRVEGSEPDDAQNAFDLSVFKHAGRAQAPDPLAAAVPDVGPEPDADLAAGFLARSYAARERARTAA